MNKNLIVLLIVIAILAIPFFLRPAKEKSLSNADKLVILSPHNETIRYEFEYAFRKWYSKRYSKHVIIDWRNLGGTSEIGRFIDSEFEASPNGIGIDLFFGGGQYDHAKQAEKKHTVPCGLKKRHPEWLKDNIIPQQVSGEIFYDTNDHWYGCCISSFGICYNKDVLHAKGIHTLPAKWEDLGQTHFFRLIALADPAKSGSITKAFEMLIQQQISEEIKKQNKIPEHATDEDLKAGWRRAMNVIRQIAANTRYFTDSASKVPLDVAQGNAAAGMSIDFYGRFQNETIMHNENSQRLEYITPVAGSSFSVDPISLMRGAPHKKLAQEFIDFVLSRDGQKLWNYQVGTPKGPIKYALRRLPIRKDLYSSNNIKYMSDPDAMPYQHAASFIYRPQWTGSLFGLIRILIKAMCMNTHDELVKAQQAINQAGKNKNLSLAIDVFTVLPSDAEYITARNVTASALSDKIKELHITREWTIFFRKQYKKTENLLSNNSVR